MASRFWVGGTATWDAANTANWAATSGGAGGQSVPGAADTVTFDALSGGGVVTVGAAYNPSVISITMGAFTGTLDFATNNGSPTMATFSCSGTGVRTLNMGSGTWTITGNNTTIFNCSTVTNLTMNFGTSTVNCTYAGATGTRTINLGSGTVGQLFNLNITAGTDIVSLTGSGSVNINGDLNFTGFSGNANAGTSNLYGNFTLSPTMTWVGAVSVITFKATSGTKTINTNGVVFSQSVTFDGIGGTWQLLGNFDMGTASLSRIMTLTNGTFNANNFNVSIPNFSSSNSNVRTLTMGSGTWTLTGNAGTIWNVGTTVNMTQTTSTATIIASYSGSVGTRSISSMNNASNLVGPTFRVTGGSDTISFINSSPRYQSIDFTGFSGTLVNGSAVQINIASSLTMSPTMTNSFTGNIVFNGTDSANTGNLISNGVTFNGPLDMTKVGFTLTLSDRLTSTSTFAVTNGTFNANNFDITVFSFNSSGAGVRTLLMGTGTWTLTGTGTIWNTNTTTNLTYSKTKATIKPTSPFPITLTGGGLRFYRLFDGTLANTTLTNIFFDYYNDGTTRNIARGRAQTTARPTSPRRVVVRDMGTALSFDGVSNTVNIGTTNTPIFASGGFASCWFKARSIGTVQSIIAASKTNTDRIAITLLSTGRIGSEFNNTTNFYRASSTNSVIPNQWYFVTFTYDGATTAKLFINGVLQVGVTGATTAGSIGTRVGSRAGDFFFNGIIDEPTVGTTILSDAAAQQLYFNQVVPVSNIRWLFNETTGLVALDSSGNGNNGTITGATYTTDTPIKLRTKS